VFRPGHAGLAIQAEDAASEFVDKPSEFILQFDKNGNCRVTQDEMKGASTDQKPTNGRGKKF
jgi:hypothetical protein